MTRPIKRKRRTKEEMDAIRDGLYQILSDDHPQTVRGVFYQATTRGIIPKTEDQYKTTICRLLTNMRRDGYIPYYWLSDNTRWMRKPTTYDSLEKYLKDSWRYYRRSVWADTDAYVEIWMEKDALAGLVYEITEEWDVPLMVTRGYPSLSFLHTAGVEIKTQYRPTYIYYFGELTAGEYDRLVELNEVIMSLVDRVNALTDKAMLR